MPTPARIFLLIGLAALLTTLLCSVTVHVRESRHTGEPLLQKTLAEITAAPSTSACHSAMRAGDDPG